MDITGKTILVTGAASGLGAATASYLTELGANVVGCDCVEISVKLSRTFQCDVTDEKQVQQMLSHVGALHGVVNCAGVVHAKRVVGRAGAMALDEFQRVIQINLVGTFNIIRLCAEKMSQQEMVNELGERGVIISTASVAAFEGQLGQAAYSASKAGVAGMTLPIARELAQFGIRVMTIAPGVMQTPMMALLSEEVRQQLAADIPFPKQLGDPLFFAKMVVSIFDNTYLNGEVIRLDGALRLQ